MLANFDTHTQMGICDHPNLQMLVMAELQMTFWVFGANENANFGIFYPQLGIFYTPNKQILEMGDPQMMFWGIWSKNKCLQIVTFLTPIWPFLTAPNL